MPTTFNFLGPLANPAHVKRQAVGVSDETMATRMLGALRALGAEHVMVFHGDDGLDELTTTTTSTVHHLVDGEARTFTVDPREFGIERSPADTLTGGDAATNAAAVRAVLGGEPSPHRDIALLNAAAALTVAGLASDLAHGVELAVASIDSGHAAARARHAGARQQRREVERGGVARWLPSCSAPTAAPSTRSPRCRHVARSRARGAGGS